MEVEDTSVTQLEAAIAESLEDVVRRAEQLQQHLVDLPGPSRLIQPGDVGSPERLRALALGTPYEQMRVASAGSTYYGAISDELVYDELAAEPYGLRRPRGLDQSWAIVQSPTIAAHYGIHRSSS